MYRYNLGVGCREVFSVRSTGYIWRHDILIGRGDIPVLDRWALSDYDKVYNVQSI
jgi:hypothetical protein